VALDERPVFDWARHGFRRHPDILSALELPVTGQQRHVAVGCVSDGAGRAIGGGAGDAVDGTGASGEIGRQVSDDGRSPRPAVTAGANRSIGCAAATPGAAAAITIMLATANVSRWDMH